MHRLYLGLGSNLGERKTLLDSAIRSIEHKIGQIQKISPFYETEPWGVENQTPYLNVVVEVLTTLWPLAILHLVQEIEKEGGRERKERWGSRTIDIDILFFNQEIFTFSDLQVPHPRILDRNFVLYPLADLAPNLVHPVFNKNILELKEQCKDTSWICAY